MRCSALRGYKRKTNRTVKLKAQNMNFYVAITELSKLVPEAKEVGADLFFEYAPHVNRVHVRLFAEGWSHKTYPDLEFQLRAPGDPLGETPHEGLLVSIQKLINQQKISSNDTEI